MRHVILIGLFGTACTGMINTDPGPGSNMMPPPTDVQIVVRDGDSPQPNVPIIFQGPDSTIIAELATDATGLATAEMPDGGSVTIIRTYPLDTQQQPPQQRPAEATTYLGVKAGDRLSFGNASDDLSVASAVNVKVPDGAQGTVTVSAKCGSGQGTPPLVPITVRNCGATIGLYVTDGDNSSFFKVAPYSENIDVSTEILAGTLASQISATNVLPGTTVSVEERLGLEGWSFFSTGAQRVDTNPAQVNLPSVSGVEQLTITSITNNNQTQIVASRKAYSGGTISVDGSVRSLASMDQPMFTPAAITWVEQNPGTAPDLVIASLDVTRAMPGANNTYVRRIVAPYGGATLAIPVLAGANTIYNPTMDDQVATSLGLATVTGGYDAFRPVVLSNASILDAAPMGTELTLSYTGTLPGL